MRNSIHTLRVGKPSAQENGILKSCDRALDLVHQAAVGHEVL